VEWDFARVCPENESLPLSDALTIMALILNAPVNIATVSIASVKNAPINGNGNSARDIAR
jgi:hypothetical protein